MKNPENGNETFDDYLKFTHKANPLYISDNKSKSLHHQGCYEKKEKEENEEEKKKKK